jgi:hypothetical protein
MPIVVVVVTEVAYRGQDREKLEEGSSRIPGMDKFVSDMPMRAVRI